jgi:Uma2 family endonuclease
MATAVEPKPARVLEGEQRVLLCGVGWDGYETLLRLAGDSGCVRITYDRGDVELMSPSRDHDTYARLIGRLIDVLTEEFDIPCEGLRTTTWRRQARERGLEGDDCFYLASLPRVAGKTTIDLNVDPPPDLAVEVEISRGRLDKLGVYAGLGVPEVWRFDGEMLTILRLQPDGTYAAVPESPSLPEIRPEEVARWVCEGVSVENRTAWARRLRAWVREVLVPRRQGQDLGG